MARILAAALSFAAVEASAAEQQTALPILSPCAQTAPPELPARWRAVALMLPFVRQQIDVGEFIYDGTLPAMRATLIGLESGAVDLLITANETYLLTGPREAPNACVALGKKYSPPGARWFTGAPVCDGIGPVGAARVQWWKTAAPDGRSQWQWYKDDSKLPFRTMFPARMAEPAVIGDYGMSYFASFAPLSQTGLARLRDFCAAKARKAGGAMAAAQTARELMALGQDLAEAERAKQIQALVPGLSRQACTGLSPARWPHQFVMTGILSPVPAKWTPLPSMIFYDWDKAVNLSAWMYEARTQPPVLELVSVLSNGVGYSIERQPNGDFACAAKSPGAVRPDWMAVAGCECKAVIDRNPELGPDEVSQIRACPVRNQGLRVNWAWYTTQGRPILFAEPGAAGTGLNIADYLQWLPDAKMPQDSFELPKLCTAQAAQAGLPPVGSGLPASVTSSCTDCHTTR